MSHNGLNKGKRNLSAKREAVEQKILDAALKIIYEKGFDVAKISDVAKESQITEPTIYQYFKGKEDLLFRVVEELSEKSLQYVNEHIQGIVGAQNKLRKFIWSYLKYNDLHREYLTLVLLDCRNNIGFYSSKAHDIVRKYSSLCLSILNEGINEGVFQSDINTSLVRDLILGALDTEAYTMIATNEINDTSSDYESLMLLFDNMLFKKEDKLSVINKRERILRAAIVLFANKGYAGTTISEIAKISSLSDGTVYEYFKNKEDLLFSIPEKRYGDHLKLIDESYGNNNKLMKIKKFIIDHFRLYLYDKNFLMVHLLLISFNSQFCKSKAYNSWVSYNKIIEELVHEGIEMGFVNPNCNGRVFRNIFLGAFTSMCLRWFIVNSDDKFDKLYEINEIANILTDCIEIECRGEI